MDFIKSKVFCLFFSFLFYPLINSYFVFNSTTSPTNDIKEEINKNKVSSKISDFSSVATSFKSFPKVEESKTVIGVDLMVE